MTFAARAMSRRALVAVAALTTIGLVFAQIGTSGPRVPLPTPVAAMLDTVIVIVVRERGTRPAVTLSIGTTAFVKTEFAAALSARTHSTGALLVVGTFVSIGLVLA